jgi:hypothetical protein
VVLRDIGDEAAQRLSVTIGATTSPAARPSIPDYPTAHPRRAHSSVFGYVDALIFQRNFFSIARRDPNCEPTKISGADFRGEIARFRFNEASATIDNDRSILRFDDHPSRRAASSRNTVIALARSAINRHRPARQVSRFSTISTA